MRSGLQYGADYVLYPRHPSQAHSSFCALVVPPAAAAPPGACATTAHAVRHGFPCWPELQGLSRLCVQARHRASRRLIQRSFARRRPSLRRALTSRHPPRAPLQVNKGLLVLHVLEEAAGPGDAPSGGAETANSAVERLRVVEVCVSRWNPNKGRLEAEVMGV